MVEWTLCLRDRKLYGKIDHFGGLLPLKSGPGGQISGLVRVRGTWKAYIPTPIPTRHTLGIFPLGSIFKKKGLFIGKNDIFRSIKNVNQCVSGDKMTCNGPAWHTNDKQRTRSAILQDYFQFSDLKITISIFFNGFYSIKVRFSQWNISKSYAVNGSKPCLLIESNAICKGRHPETINRSPCHNEVHLKPVSRAFSSIFTYFWNLLF